MAEIVEIEVDLAGPAQVASVIISEAAGADGAPGTNGADGADGADGDDGVGVPAGGTTGQVLKKASGTDYDTEWDDASAGSGDVVGPSSSVTARIATYNGTTGKLIADGGSTIANILDRTNHTGTQAISTVTSLQASLDAKAATSHTHAISDTTGLQAAIDAKAASSHTHTISDTTGLQAALDAKAASSHTHAIADTTGLQAALDAKAASSHTHAAGDITGLATSATTDTTSATNITSGTLPIARIADGAVTHAKLANLALSTLIGRYTASTGVPETITVGGDFSLSGGTLSLVINPTNATNLASGTVADARLSANVPLINAANTFTAANIISVNGAASTPPMYLSGTWFTGGTGTTTKPALLVQPSATASTAWSTSGTGIGVNAPSGFAGQLIDLKVNDSTTVRFRVDANAIASTPGVNINTNTGVLQFGVGLDVILGRDAAATLQMGTDAASPVTQTFKGTDSRAGTDTNTAGGVLNIAAGRGTGTAAGGNLILQTAIATTSGTAAGTLVGREFYYGGEKTLTESTATIVANITLAASKYIGGVITATTHADDGTDFQAITETLAFSAVNKAGTVTTTIQAAPTSSTTAASAGTLATTWTSVVNGNSIDIKNSAVSSLTQTTLKVSFKITLNGDAAAVIT